MLLSLVGAIFGALKAWVMRAVLGWVGAVWPEVEMGGKGTFAAFARTLDRSRESSRSFER
jgi:hypothetical protein